MMKKIMWKEMAMTLSVVALLGACSDEVISVASSETDGQGQSSLPYTGEVVTLNSFEASVETGSGPKTRAMYIGDSLTNSQSNISFDSLVTSKDLIVCFALRKPGMDDAQVTYGWTKAIAKKRTAGGYTIVTRPIQVQMRQGTLDDTYRMQLSFSEAKCAPKDLDKREGYAYSFSDMNTNREGKDANAGIIRASKSARGRKGMFQIHNLPFATSWCNVSVKDANGRKSVEPTAAEFLPQGTLIKVMGRSNLFKKVWIKSVKIAAKGLSFHGEYRLGRTADRTQLNDKGMVFESLKATREEEVDDVLAKGGLINGVSTRKYSLAFDNNTYDCVDGMDKNKKNRETEPYYLYVAPTTPTSDSDKESNYIKFAYEYTVEDPKLNPNTPVSWTPDEVISVEDFEGNPNNQKWFTNSYTYTLAKYGFSTGSELMITELYHLNPSGTNTSMLEIANPTNKPVDLRQYSVIRIRNFGATTGPEIHIADSKLRYDTSGRSYLATPVYVDPKVPSGTIPAKNIMGQDFATVGYRIRYRYPYDTQKYAQADDGYMLQPGQTIVLLGSGLLQSFETERNTEYRPINGTDVGFGGWLWDEGIDKRNCKYVLAITDGYCQHNGDYSNEYQYTHTSGVMTIGKQHTMALVKKDKIRGNDGKEYNTMAIIDVTGPAFDYCDYFDFMSTKGWEYQAGRWKDFVECFGLADPLGMNRDDVGLIRKPNVLFPSPHKFWFDFKKVGENQYEVDATNPTNQWDMYLIAGSQEAKDKRPWLYSGKGKVAFPWADRCLPHNFGTAFIKKRY